MKSRKRNRRKERGGETDWFEGRDLLARGHYRSESRSNELIVNYRESGVAWITNGTAHRCNSRRTDFRVPLYRTWRTSRATPGRGGGTHPS